MIRLLWKRDYDSRRRTEGACRRSQPPMGSVRCRESSRAHRVRSAHLHIRRVQQLELLKFLEQPHVRDARRIVYTKIRERPADDEWWKSKDNECWERAASLVCATYDIVDITAMRKNRRFFETYWGPSIRWSYKALLPYIQHRSKEQEIQAYRGYTRLYNRAIRNRPPTSSANGKP